MENATNTATSEAFVPQAECSICKEPNNTCPYHDIYQYLVQDVPLASQHSSDPLDVDYAFHPPAGSQSDAPSVQHIQNTFYVRIETINNNGPTDFFRAAQVTDDVDAETSEEEEEEDSDGNDLLDDNEEKADETSLKDDEAVFFKGRGHSERAGMREDEDDENEDEENGGVAF